ncbi:hypothetical protein BTJ40_15345 [Microbulbifer sp. A4B17]|uniref:hypothetical protein n=1 Tax=Microbulbifer sp. A4B17 TaxID=359370 RepID=UPI000D52D0B1|nr:hypothetical protein [Microbulbifer sp. A4B17]AWF82094.1 hypothetical protein BTJ40_15345 [Microbulbifer sp. A4B17]
MDSTFSYLALILIGFGEYSKYAQVINLKEAVRRFYDLYQCALGELGQFYNPASAQFNFFITPKAMLLKKYEVRGGQRARYCFKFRKQLIRVKKLKVENGIEQFQDVIQYPYDPLGRYLGKKSYNESVSLLWDRSSLIQNLFLGKDNVTR